MSDRPELKKKRRTDCFAAAWSLGAWSTAAEKKNLSSSKELRLG